MSQTAEYINKQNIFFFSLRMTLEMKKWLILRFKIAN